MKGIPKFVTSTAIDIDLTDDCNLRCVYCFKGPKTPRYIEMETARAAVDWVIRASRDYPEISVNFMGGEPLLSWDIIRELVPWARRRAHSFGKRVYFSMTTNLTLMNQEIRDFVDQNGFGVLMSIDGCPELHDKQRVAIKPEHRFKTVEYWAISLLKTRPRSDARFTLIPKNVSLLSKSFEYLTREVGFRSVSLSLADYPDWSDEYFKEYQKQLDKISYIVEESYYMKNIIYLKTFSWYLKKFFYPLKNNLKIEKKNSPCGAGYNYQMIDFNGDIWPCHRFDGAIQLHGLENEMKMGNVFSDYYNDKLANAFLNFNFKDHLKPECKTCPILMQCAGGCPAANLYYMRDIYTPHPNNCRLRWIEYEVAEKLYERLSKKNCEAFLKDMATPFS
ncbi:SPASM domain-containing protein [Candidatus Sumerlaeota bacterium]|nr:SPASM domain-containing protein [Candidatus Sumerlaeota bacterium]